MVKMKKVRTSAWVDPSWILLLNERGLTLSSYIAKSLPLFLGLPEDPMEKLIQKDITNMVLRVRSTYINEIRDRSTLFDAEKEKERQKLVPLIKIGEKLQRTTCYQDILKALADRDVDAECWPVALDEINNMNGSKLEFYEFWNLSLQWYDVLGKSEKAKV
jgi:hypothetical protein